MNIHVSKDMFNPIYLPLLEDYEHRYITLYGGSGSGKSDFGFMKAIWKAINYPGRTFLVIRKVQKTLKKSCWRLVNRILRRLKIFNTCKINKTDMEIELENGSLFMFSGLDDPEKIKSIDGVDDIIIEEATDLDKYDFLQLDLRLRSDKGMNQIMLFFNPIGKDNWVYKYFFSDEPEYDKDKTVILHTTYKDNKFLPKENIEAIESMKKKDYAYYSIYALGEFATLDKLVFSNWHTENFDHEEIYKREIEAGNKKIKYIYGLDFGYSNDPSAFVCALKDDNNRKLYVFDGFYRTHMLNRDIAEEIIDMGYAKEHISADCASPKDIEDLRTSYNIRYIQGCTKGKGSIISGINYLKQYEIILNDNLVSITDTGKLVRWAEEELKNYSHKKDKSTGEYLEEPIDKYNHFCDALRYACTADIDAVDRSVKFMEYRELF